MLQNMRVELCRGICFSAQLDMFAKLLQGKVGKYYQWHADKLQIGTTEWWNSIVLGFECEHLWNHVSALLLLYFSPICLALNRNVKENVKLTV